MMGMVEAYGCQVDFRPPQPRNATDTEGKSSVNMLRHFHHRLSEMPYMAIGLLSSVLILLVAALDHVTGHEISFSIFFLIPILIAVGYGDRNMGYAAGILSACAWFTVEKISENPYSQPWILYWNSGVRLMFFLLFAYLAAHLRANLVRQSQLARTDSLTGLLNRTGFMESAAGMFGTASHQRNATTIAFIDLNHFKKVNDMFGHEQGDAVLGFVAKELSRSLRRSDVVARYGGDEFAVLLPNTNSSGATVLLEKLYDQVLEGLRDSGWSVVGLSIGAIVLDRGDVNLAEALHTADTLMYRAKNSGSGKSSKGVIIESVSERGTGTFSRLPPGT
jgi:diguanylate cyclase (GGDEF)-like protein